jgi:hypothetical protein
VKTKNARELLLALGIGQFNATMIVPYMFVAPATTDPKSAQTILIVQHLQKALYDLGATDVPQSGRLDAATAQAMERVAGANWERMSWAANVSAVVSAKEAGVSLRAPPAPRVRGTPVAVGGVFDFLPDVPGGLVTYAVGALVLYRHLTRKARA